MGQREHRSGQLNHSLVELKGPFVGADLNYPVPGAEGGSKARSGTGATRRETSMARTNPLTRPSTWQQSSMGGLNLMSEHGEDQPFDAPEHLATIVNGWPESDEFPILPTGRGERNAGTHPNRPPTSMIRA